MSCTLPARVTGNLCRWRHVVLQSLATVTGHAPIYQSWAASDRGLLWIKGNPGSGKSTLVKYALGSCGARDNALVLSFFFHGRGDELQRTPLGLFRSLLHQVLRRFPDVLPDLVDIFKTKCNEFGEPGVKWQWHQEELQHLFQSCLPRVLTTRPVWVFLERRWWQVERRCCMQCFLAAEVTRGARGGRRCRARHGPNERFTSRRLVRQWPPSKEDLICV